MKLLLTILMTTVISLNASDATSRVFKPAIQSAIINLHHDDISNTVVAHHHFQHAGAFYDTIVTKSLTCGYQTVKSYKSSIKAGVIVPALSNDEQAAIVDLLKTKF